MVPEIDFVEFVAVANTGSFSAAARLLGVSKSHVSKKVSALERRLGVQLLHRSTRKLSLTDVGRIYYGRCAQVLDDIQDAETEVLEANSEPIGVLNISLPNTFGEQFVIPLLSQFMRLHRGLRVNANLTTRNVDLIEEGYDMAVRIGDAPDDRLIVRTLCSTRFIVCASPAYLEKFGIPKCSDDLQNHACLSFSVQGLVDEARWTIDNASGHEKIPVNTVFVSNIGDSLITAARCGVGLVYLPDLFVRQAIVDSTLVQVLPEFSLTTSVSAVYPFRRHMSYKIRMVVEFLTENLALVTDWRNYQEPDTLNEGDFPENPSTLGTKN